MSLKYNIITEFVKDISSEIPDVETFLSAKENLSTYQLHIDIKSKPLKNKIIEVDIFLRFEDKKLENKRAHFEITYAAIIKFEDVTAEKEDVEKAILCDIPKAVSPKLEKILGNLLENSGFEKIVFENQLDFEKLYNERKATQKSFS